MKAQSFNLLFASCVLLSSTMAAAGEPAEGTQVTFDGQLTTQIHVRNDSDFDSTERYDDLDGQTEGQAATFFAPRLTIEIPGQSRIVYAAELGWNAWSRNNPGQPEQFGQSAAPGHRGVANKFPP